MCSMSASRSSSERIGRLAGCRWLCSEFGSSSGLCDIEAQQGVRGDAFGVHAVEDWYANVDVVVEFDVVFAFVGAQETPDVLDDASFEGEREREEQCVEFGPVESLTKVGAGGDKNDAFARVASG